MYREHTRPPPWRCSARRLRRRRQAPARLTGTDCRHALFGPYSSRHPGCPPYTCHSTLTVSGGGRRYNKRGGWLGRKRLQAAVKLGWRELGQAALPIAGEQHAPPPGPRPRQQRGTRPSEGPGSRLLVLLLRGRAPVALLSPSCRPPPQRLPGTPAGACRQGDGGGMEPARSALVMLLVRLSPERAAQPSCRPASAAATTLCCPLQPAAHKRAEAATKGLPPPNTTQLEHTSGSALNYLKR